jgi:AcrR family transcriptional regulator
MSLARKKGYDAVTVGGICEAAKVGRSTFYGHFAGKDDLKRSGLEHLRQELLGHRENAPATSSPARERRLSFSLPMFEHAREHIETYRALAGTRGGEVALGAIREILADLLRRELAQTAGTKASGAKAAGAKTADAMPRELVIQIAVDAFMTVLTWWLNSGAKLPPHQIDTMFRRLATEGLLCE